MRDNGDGSCRLEKLNPFENYFVQIDTHDLFTVACTKHHNCLHGINKCNRPLYYLRCTDKSIAVRIAWKITVIELHNISHILLLLHCKTD